MTSRAFSIWGAWPHLGMTTWRTLRIWSAARIEPGTSEITRSFAPQISKRRVRDPASSGATEWPTVPRSVRRTPFFHFRSWNFRSMASTSSSLAKWRAVEDRLDQGVVLAAPDPLHHRQVLVAVEARGADQDQPRDLLGVPRRVGQDDLAAQARADQVVGRALDVLVEVVGQPVGQVVDGDLAPVSIRRWSESPS